MNSGWANKAKSLPHTGQEQVGKEAPSIGGLMLSMYANGSGHKGAKLKGSGLSPHERCRRCRGDGQVRMQGVGRHWCHCVGW